MKVDFSTATLLPRLRALVRQYSWRLETRLAPLGTYEPKRVLWKGRRLSVKQTKEHRFRSYNGGTSVDVGPGTYLAPSNIIKKSFNVTYSTSKDAY